VTGVEAAARGGQVGPGTAAGVSVGILFVQSGGATAAAEEVAKHWSPFT
jgi:hypothetical protein